jgi:hypothetical protein
MRRREARGTLQTCWPNLSATVSYTLSSNVPQRLTVQAWADWQGGIPHWGAPGGVQPGVGVPWMLGG